jgi:hypothetical protein
MLALLLACAPDSHDGRTPRPRPGEPDRPAVSDSGEPPTSPTSPTSPTVPEATIAVCLNELMPANLASGPGDWLELHNPTAQDVSLDGWSLTDDPTEPRRHVLSGGLVLEAGGFLVLWASDLSFTLPDDGGAIGLFDPDGDGSVVRYGPMIPDVSLARITDCCFDAAEACFGYGFAGTPGASNAP